MNEIFLGAQFGGADAGAKFSGVSVLIRKRLKELKKTYCKDIENFQLFLRVSGEITAFKEFSGIHHIRLLKKKKSVTADIIIAREIWADKNEEQLREYLSLQVIEAISLMCRRIEAEKLEVNTKEFIADLRKILK